MYTPCVLCMVGAPYVIYRVWCTRTCTHTDHIQASACCKHFVANSMEGTTEKDGEEEDRMHVDSNVTLQDLIDSYMVPFQACVEQGKVSGLMCSYNSVNGVPSCANDWLLKDVARGEWGFDGYVTSDCDADALVSGPHHYHNDTPEAAREPRITFPRLLC